MFIHTLLKRFVLTCLHFEVAPMENEFYPDEISENDKYKDVCMRD